MQEVQAMNTKIEDNSYFKLWWLFIEASFFSSKARNKELSQYGITMEQAGILFCIKVLGDNVTSAELGRQRGRERNTMSEALSVMTRKGFITKTQDSVNKNQIRIQLTPKGRDIIEKYDRKESLHDIFSCLSEDELLLLEQLLRKIHKKALYLNEMNAPLEFLTKAFN